MGHETFLSSKGKRYRLMYRTTARPTALRAKGFQSCLLSAPARSESHPTKTLIPQIRQPTQNRSVPRSRVAPGAAVMIDRIQPVHQHEVIAFPEIKLFAVLRRLHRHDAVVFPFVFADNIERQQPFGMQEMPVMFAAHGEIANARSVEDFFIERLAICPRQIVEALVGHADHVQERLDESFKPAD